MRQPTEWENKSLPAINPTEDQQNTQGIKKNRNKKVRQPSK